MNKLEMLTERFSRGVARHTSRRSFIGRLGLLLVGGGSLPLLPIARAAGVEATQPVGPEPAQKGYPGVAPQPPISPAEQGDPASCDYWRYCGLAGALCACCGGSANACPPGAQMSPLGWVGTCRNPVDGKNYIISYNDCCGKPLCARCACYQGVKNPKNRPPIRPQSSVDFLWCLGINESSFTCSTANVLGVALDQE
jgi:methylamine dehydrogenase light chain